MPSLVLLNIAAAVCLLLWGLGNLKSGMMKGFGKSLRHLLERSTSNRLSALGSGIAITLMVQSSTAAILLVGTFISQGLVSVSAGIALALGADIGTALVAIILSIDLSWLMPVLLIVGFIFYSLRSHSVMHNLGRILSGLGLMLLALAWIRDSAAPLAESDVLPVILQPLAQDPVFGIIIAAILAWVMHSSLAAILLFVSLAATEVITPGFGLYLVLGANLGGAMPAIMVTLRDQPKVARVPLANGLLRFAGVALVFPFMALIEPALFQLLGGQGASVIGFHLIFNLGLAALALGFTPWIADIAQHLRPETEESEEDEGRPRYLNPKVLETPGVALSDVSRETLRMAELLQDMLENSLYAFETNNRAVLKRIKEEDHTIDRLYGAIKDYLAQLLAQEALSPEQATRAVHILTFATNLEHAGDVIDKNLMPMADKKIRNHYRFSEEGFEEIKDYHSLVLDSVIQAQRVFMSEDQDLAQRMIDTKRGDIREAEQRAAITHVARLTEGVPETIATTSLHLDIIRDMRRVNTYMCAVAYNVLNQSKIDPERIQEEIQT